MIDEHDQSLIDRGLALCPACDYKLTGLGRSDGNCPECGWEYDEDAIAWELKRGRIYLFGFIALYGLLMSSFSTYMAKSWILFVLIFPGIPLGLFCNYLTIRSLFSQRSVIAIGPSGIINRSFFPVRKPCFRSWDDERSVETLSRYFGSIALGAWLIHNQDKLELINEFNRQVQIRSGTFPPKK